MEQQQQQQQNVFLCLQQWVLHLQHICQVQQQQHLESETELLEVLEELDHLKQRELQVWRNQFQRIMAVQQLTRDLAPGNENHPSLYML